MKNTPSCFDFVFPFYHVEQPKSREERAAGQPRRLSTRATIKTILDRGGFVQWNANVFCLRSDFTARISELRDIMIIYSVYVPAERRYRYYSDAGLANIPEGAIIVYVRGGKGRRTRRKQRAPKAAATSTAWPTERPTPWTFGELTREVL